MEVLMKTIMVHEMPDHLGETVRIGAWLANKDLVENSLFYNYVTDPDLFKVSLQKK